MRVNPATPINNVCVNRLSAQIQLRPYTARPIGTHQRYGWPPSQAHGRCPQQPGIITAKPCFRRWERKSKWLFCSISSIWTRGLEGPPEASGWEPPVHFTVPWWHNWDPPHYCAEPSTEWELPARLIHSHLCQSHPLWTAQVNSLSEPFRQKRRKMSHLAEKAGRRGRITHGCLYFIREDRDSCFVCPCYDSELPVSIINVFINPHLISISIL